MSTAKSRFWLGLLATLALFIIVACGSNSSTGGSNTTSSSSTLVPFDTFLQNVSHAQYSDYSSLPTAKVQDEQAFNQMRDYILKLYTGRQVANSYIVNGRSFDCLVNTSVSKQANPPAPSGSQGSANNSGQANTSTSSHCKTGTIPMERVTLERLVQFPTLQAFLGKGPGNSSAPPIPTPNQ